MTMKKSVIFVCLTCFAYLCEESFPHVPMLRIAFIRSTKLSSYHTGLFFVFSISQPYPVCSLNQLHMDHYSELLSKCYYFIFCNLFLGLTNSDIK